MVLDAEIGQGQGIGGDDVVAFQEPDLIPGQGRRRRPFEESALQAGKGEVLHEDAGADLPKNSSISSLKLYI